MSSFHNQQVRQSATTNNQNKKDDNPQMTKQLQRPRPYHKLPPNVGERLHHRSWSNLDLEGKIEDIRLQLIMAEGRLCHYIKGADVSKEMRNLSYFLLSPIRFGDRMKHDDYEHLKQSLSNWTDHLPKTRDRAIQAMERMIKNCDKQIAKIHLKQKNEFLYTMGIRRQDLEPSGEDIFKQVFAEEIEEREAAQA